MSSVEAIETGEVAATISNSSVAATIGNPIPVTNQDANKINIYYDYEEDHHYSIKLEDSLLFEEEYSGKTIQIILGTFKIPDESLTSAEYIIKGIYHSITNETITKQTLSGTILLFLEKYDGINLLHSILTLYSAESATIATYGCLILIILIAQVEDLKELFGAAGFCDLLVYILQVNTGIAQVSEYGAYAVAAFTKLHFPNIRRFSKVGQPLSLPASPNPKNQKPREGSQKNTVMQSAERSNALLATTNVCEILGQIGVFGCNVRHPRSVYIARNVCLAIGNICEPLFTKWIKNYQIIPLLVQLYQLHYRNKQIFVHSMFYSIHRLLLLHPNFINDFLQSQVFLKEIFNPMIEYYQRDIPVLVRIWQVLIHCYQRALSTSSSSPMSSKSAVTAAVALNPFQQELLKNQTHGLLVFKIFQVLNYEKLVNEPEIVWLSQVAEEMHPHDGTTAIHNHFELLESHTICEKYIRFILKVKQLYSVSAESFDSYAEQVKTENTSKNFSKSQSEKSVIH